MQMRSNEKMRKNHLHKMTLVSFSHAPPPLLCVVCVIAKKNMRILKKSLLLIYFFPSTGFLLFYVLRKAIHIKFYERLLNIK